MESKFIVCVVFACLARGSYALSSVTGYGLSEEESAVIFEITVNQEATVLDKFDAFNPIFDILEKLASQSIFNLQAETEDDSTIIDNALAKAKEAIDISLNSIPIILGESCSSVETTRVVLYNIIDDIYVLIPKAIVLAQSGNYSKNRAQLEVLQAAAQTDFTNSVEHMYGAFRTCLDITDVDTLAVIETAQNRSRDGLFRSVGAVFNAIKVYEDVLSKGNQGVAPIFTIEEFRDQALIALRSDIENKFSTLKTLYVNSKLNHTGIVRCLATNQFAHTRLIYKLRDVGDVIYDAIVNGLKKVVLGLNDDSGDDFSRNDASQAEVIARLKAINHHVVTSFCSIQPVADSEVTAAEEELSIMIDQLVPFYYSAIKIAQAEDTTQSEILGKIQEYVQNSTSQAGNYAQIIFDLMVNNEGWDNNTAAQIAILQSVTAVATERFIDSIFDAIKILASASFQVESASEDYLSAILINKSKAVSTVSIFANAIFFAHQIALIVGD